MPARPPQPTRRAVLKGAAAVGLTAAFSRWSKLTAADAAAVKTDSKTADNTKYNVLFLMSDDMRPELSMYGNPLVAAPNLAGLAKSGVLFQRGYCQFPLCNPSRSSMLTGRQVINTGIMDNVAYFWTQHPELVSLPKYFLQHGYTTARVGKIFHFDDGPAWTVGGQTGGSAESETGRRPLRRPRHRRNRPLQPASFQQRRQNQTGLLRPNC